MGLITKVRTAKTNGTSKRLFILGSFVILAALILLNQNGAYVKNAIESTSDVLEMHLGSEESSNAACQKMLDTFDAKFDLRRANRQKRTDAVENRTGMKKTHAYDLHEPEAVCFDEERFGSVERFDAFSDGPKFVCGVDAIAAKSKTPEGCLVYSVGSNNQIDFEVAVTNYMGCETHTFDPTLAKPFIGGKYATFHPWGIGKDGDMNKARGKKWASKGIETIMKKLGHTNRTLDILKIDCEGCEFVAMPILFDAIAAGRVKVNQIQVELHGSLFEPVELFFQKADKAKMRIFHKERNHWGCDGYKCLEYALISEDFLREANAASVCNIMST